MTGALLAVYQWWRWRPHCKPGRHVVLCRLITPYGHVWSCDPGRPRPGYPQ